MRRITSRTEGHSPIFSSPNNAISSGTSENSKMLSKQKISATGAAACEPSVDSASPGPI